MKKLGDRFGSRNVLNEGNIVISKPKRRIFSRRCSFVVCGEHKQEAGRARERERERERERGGERKRERGERGEGTEMGV